MAKALNAHDYRRRAKNRLPRIVFDYLEGGAEDEIGLKRNCTAFGQWELLPGRLRDVSKRSFETSFLGHRHAMPVFVCPTGVNDILRPGADAMIARAAAKAGIPFALSTAASMSIEEVAKVCDGEKWFQLYVLHREIAKMLVRRARDADYDALILTVDVPVNGYRERDFRNGFGLPVRYSPRMLLDGIRHPAWTYDYLRNGTPRMRNFETPESQNAEMQAALLRREMDASFDWDALAALRDEWQKPLIIKGILRSDDVARCKAMGVDAVILSNHGGRQLDTAPPSISVLDDMEVGMKDEADLPLLLDSGVRRGSDVVKALCLGASMVGIGRPLLYAVAADGEAGCNDFLKLLAQDIDRTLALMGVADICNLDRGCIRRRN